MGRLASLLQEAGAAVKPRYEAATHVTLEEWIVLSAMVVVSVAIVAGIVWMLIKLVVRVLP